MRAPGGPSSGKDPGWARVVAETVADTPANWNAVGARQAGAANGAASTSADHLKGSASVLGPSEAAAIELIDPVLASGADGRVGSAAALRPELGNDLSFHTALFSAYL